VKATLVACMQDQEPIDSALIIPLVKHRNGTNRKLAGLMLLKLIRGSEAPDVRIVNAVLELVNDPVQAVRMEFVEKAQYIRDDSVGRIFCELMNDPSDEIRLSAARYLAGQITLLERLGDSPPETGMDCLIRHRSLTYFVLEVQPSSPPGRMGLSSAPARQSPEGRRGEQEAQRRQAPRAEHWDVDGGRRHGFDGADVTGGALRTRNTALVRGLAVGRVGGVDRRAVGVQAVARGSAVVGGQGGQAQVRDDQVAFRVEEEAVVVHVRAGDVDASW